MDQRLEILHVLGAFYLRLGDPKRALALIGVAAEAAPRDLDLADVLVRCYVAMGEGEAALTHLDKLAPHLRSKADQGRFDRLRAQALWVAGRRQEARRLYGIATAAEGMPA